MVLFMNDSTLQPWENYFPPNFNRCRFYEWNSELQSSFIENLYYAGLYWPIRRTLIYITGLTPPTSGLWMNVNLYLGEITWPSSNCDLDKQWAVQRRFVTEYIVRSPKG